MPIMADNYLVHWPLHRGSLLIETRACKFLCFCVAWFVTYGGPTTSIPARTFNRNQVWHTFPRYRNHGMSTFALSIMQATIKDLIAKTTVLVQNEVHRKSP